MSRYLEVAQQALAYVDSLRVQTPRTLRGADQWRRSDDAKAPADRSLYYGSAGIALALLEQHTATGAPQPLADAVQAGEEIMNWLAGVDWLSASIATGWPGYAFVLNELARATGRADFRAAACKCIDRLHAQASVLGQGVGWIEPMPFSDITGFKGDREIFDQSVGAAGAGLALLYAGREHLHPQAGAWATAVGERLLEVAEPDPAGLRWVMMADMPFPFTAPNFAHGGAGVGYFLGQLYATTGDQRFLSAALEGARYVLSRGTVIGDDGLLICHTEEALTPFFYLGACHGPAGTGRFFMLLHELTGDVAWRRAAERLVRGVLGLGAPEQRSKGFWNNYGQCCGDAGVGDFALLMWRKTGEVEYLELAQRCAEVLINVSSLDDQKRCWRHAEHRERPGFVQAQTGYMQGAAGIASFLMHLNSCLEGRPHKLALPDWDFQTAHAAGA